MKIYLIRHAATKLNVGRRFHGRIDYELSSDGCLQAEQLGRRFTHIHLDSYIPPP